MAASRVTSSPCTAMPVSASATADLIRSATTTAARLLQRAGELGVVAPGALADLLVIDGNPLDDIRVITTPERTLKLIMKGGKIFKNELLSPNDRVILVLRRLIVGR